MSKLENLDTQERTLYKEGYFSGDYDQTLYLKRSVDDGSNKLKVYISAYSRINGELIQQGCIYFYLDPELHSSDFIGEKVKPEFRNLNIGSFLVASWIDLCLNNNYEFLGAHEKQRKPFLLYLLKTYGFEIFDKSLYETRPDVISILRSPDVLDKRKYLFFRDPKHEAIFKKTNVFQHDNYDLVPKPDGFIHLDNVILPLQNGKKNRIKYELWEDSIAEAKAEEVISRHKK